MADFVTSARWKWILGVGVIASVLLIRCAQTPTTLALASLRPESQYLGSASCKSCHAPIYETYRKTNMGHSFYLPSRQDTIETFGASAVVYDSTQDFFYYPYWKEEELWIREWRQVGTDTSYLREEKVDYVIGSGNQTRSYLMQREGYLYEMPITWYVHREIWDLSPGYRENNVRFSREIGAECMACHTGTFDFVEGSKNRFESLSLGIGCENCHGPGSIHVNYFQNGGQTQTAEASLSIANPSKLPHQAQFDVCSRCHLEGVAVPQPNAPFDDFRPGMELQKAMEVFVMQNRNADEFGVASHAERLVQSRCYIASNEKLTCNTCHPAHESVPSFDSYVAQCQSCHQMGQQPMCQDPASEALTAEQNCITCHMPAGGTVDIPHVRFHDHKIRVVAQQRDSVQLKPTQSWLELKCGTSQNPEPDLFGKAWLLYYEQQQSDSLYLIRSDELLASDSHYDRARLAFYQQNYPLALEHIQKSLNEQPQEPLRLFLLGEAQEKLGHYSQARNTFQQIYQQNIHNLEAGLKMGINLLRARRGDPSALQEAQGIFEQLLQAKPFDHRILTNLGFVYLNLGKLEQGQRQLVAALNYAPDDPQALENMVLLQLLKDNQVQAVKYLLRLVEKHPQHPSLNQLKQSIGGR
ncbi:MAG: tetratricopeptide repeat protein [Bacteroidota bacterium]